MQKQTFIALGCAIWSSAVLAQSIPSGAVQRDPNPPYGAAAGANANANVNANTNRSTSTSGTAADPSQPNGAVRAAGAPAPSSGASTAPGSTQGALPERPGAAIPSRGSTTSTGSAAPAPYDPSSTPGWSMMTPQEQQSYSGRIGSFTSAAQCRAYYEATMAQIQARARSMGQIVQSQGSGDPCAAMQRQGSLK